MVSLNIHVVGLSCFRNLDPGVRTLFALDFLPEHRIVDHDKLSQPHQVGNLVFYSAELPIRMFYLPTFPRVGRLQVDKYVISLPCHATELGHIITKKHDQPRQSPHLRFIAI